MDWMMAIQMDWMKASLMDWMMEIQMADLMVAVLESEMDLMQPERRGQ